MRPGVLRRPTSTASAARPASTTRTTPGTASATRGHEEPRIVPDSTTVLEPGMVVALEPGTYPGPWGLRVERVCVVTETGCEVLSRHEVGL